MAAIPVLLESRGIAQAAAHCTERGSEARRWRDRSQPRSAQCKDRPSLQGSSCGPVQGSFIPPLAESRSESWRGRPRPPGLARSLWRQAASSLRGPVNRVLRALRSVAVRGGCSFRVGVTGGGASAILKLVLSFSGQRLVKGTETLRGDRTR